MFGTLQPGSSLSYYRTCVLNIIKNAKQINKKALQCLYNKISMYLLCKANEVFMVGVDIRNLDINEQQHLLWETGEQNKMGKVEERLKKRKEGKKTELEFSALRNIVFIIVQAKSNIF